MGWLGRPTMAVTTCTCSCCSGGGSEIGSYNLCERVSCIIELYVEWRKYRLSRLTTSTRGALLTHNDNILIHLIVVTCSHGGCVMMMTTEELEEWHMLNQLCKRSTCKIGWDMLRVLMLSLSELVTVPSVSSTTADVVVV